MSWDDVSYVIRSKTRSAVLLKLATVKTPTILARELHTSMPNISRALRELESRGLIELVTPEVRLGKIFVASERGKDVASKLKSMEERRD